jgi:hypothetical protein
MLPLMVGELAEGRDTQAAVPVRRLRFGAAGASSPVVAPAALTQPDIHEQLTDRVPPLAGSGPEVCKDVR